MKSRARRRSKFAAGNGNRAKISKFHRDDDVLTMIAKLAYKSDRDGELDERIVSHVEESASSRLVCSADR